MTKTQYRKNYRQLVKQVTAGLREYGEAALKSKAFALEDTPKEEPFRLPNNVLRAALIHAQDTCRSIPSRVKEDTKEVTNIYIQTYPAP